MRLAEYRGTTVVVVDNVPDNVTEGALKTWLLVGLDEDDPDLSVAKVQLEDLQEQISKVDKEVRKVVLYRESFSCQIIFVFVDKRASPHEVSKCEECKRRN